jgi:hypothetical protein
MGSLLQGMTPLSFLQRDCRVCGGVCLVNVWSSWGKRERERENTGKNKKINSFSPAAHPGEEEEAQYHLKRHRVVLFFVNSG